MLKNLARDWSEEGAAERAMSYGRITEELKRIFAGWWVPCVACGDFAYCYCCRARRPLCRMLMQEGSWVRSTASPAVGGAGATAGHPADDAALGLN